VAEVEYTHGYYRELNPALLQLACLSAGVAPPADRQRYLELGFGQGHSINMHAAAGTGGMSEFWGTDFNPAHAAHAQTLAAASGARVRLFDDSFADFAARADLPEFDVIALHGVWTWVSDENRRAIVDIIRHKLRVGGLVYISYNCLPGWAPTMPLRHLMMLHAELSGPGERGMLAKVDEAIAFAQKVVDAGATYFVANPGVSERLKRLEGQDRSYLAHEFFNRDWAVMPFSEAARWLEDGKVSFAASAHLLDHFDSVNLTKGGEKLLAGIGHPVLRQSVRDYMVNQQFRRDMFIKGVRNLAAADRQALLSQQTFVLIVDPADIPMTARLPRGEVALHEDVYRPVIETLAEDSFAPKPLSRIKAHPKLQALRFGTVLQAVLVLTGLRHVQPAQAAGSEARARCEALNRRLMERARSERDLRWLASPVTGGGIAVSRMQQLCLLHLKRGGKKDAAEMATSIWKIFLREGERLLKDGKRLESPEENLARLTAQAATFVEKQLPLLEGLGVA
jgi:SAM-dependent methyltransferase